MNSIEAIAEGLADADSQSEPLTAGVQDGQKRVVTQRDLRYLKGLDDDNKIQITELDRTEKGIEVYVQSTDYAGVIGLPDSEAITIEPKLDGTALLRLLQVQESDSAFETLSHRAPIKAGEEFVDLLAELFTDELKQVMRQGIDQSYHWVNRKEDYVRGRFDIQRQLRQEGPAAPTFHCSHDELTRDTPLNQAILYAGRILMGAVSEPEIRQQLRKQVMKLRRDISLIAVSAADIQQIRLDRLNRHYEDLLRLAELVIENTFVEDVKSGSSAAYTLLLDMPDRFQDAVEAGIDRVVEHYEHTPEEPLEQFATGDFTREPKPDIVLKRGREYKLVGDMKWKPYSGRPRGADLYQLISYQQYTDTPGVLIYPGNQTNAGIVAEADIENGHTLAVVKVPVRDAQDSFEVYEKEFYDVLRQTIDYLLHT